MTWQEALKIKQNWTPEQARNDLERLILTGERPADKVVGLACQALDKQIPKKLRTDNEGWYCCPNCGETFKLFDEFMKPNKCCGRCGQSIDWSEYIIEKGGWRHIKDKYYDELVTVKLFKDNIFADDVFVTVDDDTIIVPRGVAVKIPRKHAIKLVDIESKKLEKIYPSKGDDAECVGNTNS